MPSEAELRAQANAARDALDHGSTAPAESADAKALALRRAALGHHGGAALASDAPTWGLALSGGGIRSATFCFGLLRGLAQNQVLHRFDYLSTVSGGGYIGAAFGRLFHLGQEARSVEQGLARDDSTLLWWLRSNGRYLKAAGRRDLGQAFASILRGTIASHIEAGALMLLLAAIAVLPQALGDNGHGFWWWACTLPAIYGTAAILAYWLFGAMGGDHPRESSAFRLWCTQNLAVALWWMLILAGLAVLTHASTALLALIDSIDAPGESGLGRRAGFAGLVAAGTAAAASALRPLLPYAQRAGRQLRGRARPLGALGLLNLAGLLLLALLIVCWATFAQAIVRPGWTGILPPWGRWLILVALIVAFLLYRRSRLDLINLGSLHNYYRARIERAYVSVGNHAGVYEAPVRFPASPLDPVARAITENTLALLDAAAHDDTPLADYEPHRFGGPIHLVNCCINQTVDDRTRNYNADRKGVALTVSALGLETGTASPIPLAWTDTLSSWIAISGAAASTGMGSRTAPGLASLLFLSGARLGYWFTVPQAVQETWQARVHAAHRHPHGVNERLRAGLSAGLPRASAVLSEMLARFPGLRSPAWFVSDGGHFDNTGVYALLKRRLALIVLADCGADPAYRFDDLENLVRKARIDYGAEIVFDEAPTAGDIGAWGCLRDITTEAGSACLVRARIVYDDGSVGTLVVVKPRKLADLPLDLASYAGREALFPQQGTGDQFFDEAQWEAYHQLGRLIGRQLSVDTLVRAMHGPTDQVAMKHAVGS